MEESEILDRINNLRRDIGELNTDDISEFMSLLKSASDRGFLSKIEGLEGLIDAIDKQAEALGVNKEVIESLENLNQTEDEMVISQEGFDDYPSERQTKTPDEEIDHYLYNKFAQAYYGASDYIYDWGIASESADDETLESYLEWKDDYIYSHRETDEELNALLKEKEEHDLREEYEIEAVSSDMRNRNADDIKKLIGINDEELFNSRDTRFDEIKQVLGAMKLQGDLNVFGRSKINQGEDIELFLEQVRQQTEFKLINNSKNGVTEDLYKDAYADELQRSIVELAAADSISKGKTSKKYFESMFLNLSIVAESGKKININHESLIGWQTSKQSSLKKGIDYLLVRYKKNKQELQSFKDKVDNFDEKLSDKYGNKYKTLKNLTKTAGWSAAYGIGAGFGPAGLAAVATARLAVSTRDMVKDYKVQKTKAATNGEYLSFGKYLANNKARAAGLVLTATGGIFGVANVGDVATIARSSAGALLAAGVTSKSAIQAYKTTKGTKKDKWKAAGKVVGTSVLSFAAGWATGKATGDIISDLPSSAAAAEYTPPTQESPSYNEGVQPTEELQTQDSTLVQEGQEAVPYAEQFKFDNLSEQQQGAIELVAKMDLRELNDALGLEGSERFSTTAQALSALQDGEHPEMVEKAVQFTEQRVHSWEGADGKWHHDFKDAEGLKSAADIHKGAQEWQAARESSLQVEEPATVVTPEPLHRDNFDLSALTPQYDVDENRGVIDFQGHGKISYEMSYQQPHLSGTEFENAVAHGEGFAYYNSDVKADGEIADAFFGQIKPESTGEADAEAGYYQYKNWHTGDRKFLEDMAMKDAQDLTAQHAIYQSLQAQDRPLTDLENKFVENHWQNMEKAGLTHMLCSNEQGMENQETIVVPKFSVVRTELEDTQETEVNRYGTPSQEAPSKGEVPASTSEKTSVPNNNGVADEKSTVGEKLKTTGFKSDEAQSIADKIRAGRGGTTETLVTTSPNIMSERGGYGNGTSETLVTTSPNIMSERGGDGNGTSETLVTTSPNIMSERGGDGNGTSETLVTTSPNIMSERGGDGKGTSETLVTTSPNIMSERGGDGKGTAETLVTTSPNIMSKRGGR